MCDVLSRVASDPELPAHSRRRFLHALGASAVVGGVAAAGAGCASGQAGPGSPGPVPGRGGRTRLVLLGTAGGPAFRDGTHFGVSTAVAYGDRVYVVDLGLGSLLRLQQSSLTPQDGKASMMSSVAGIFFTHMHSDHMTDWPAAYSIGTSNAVGRVGTPIEVRGPGERAQLARVFPPSRPAPPVANPGNPMFGVAGMTGYLQQAWASDSNDRARDSNFPLPETLFAVRDIDLTGVWAVDEAGIPPRLPGPLPIWTDGEVTVTATLVDHRPTAPAFAYRFDTPDGSVVVSGDTTVSENLIDLARGTDYLVHEVIDPEFVARITATLPPGVGEPLRQHLLASHTTIEQVGRDVAERAGAKNLVLTHLAPANNDPARWQLAQRGYSGRLIVGQDLMELTVG